MENVQKHTNQITKIDMRNKLAGKHPSYDKLDMSDEERKRNKAFKQKKRSLKETEIEPEEIENEYETIYPFKN